MNLSALVFGVFIAFGLGSVPSGLLIARRLGEVDLRKTGSGNIGATNVYRSFGLKWGVLVFAADAAKGLLPVLIARGLLLPPAGIGIVALFAVLGHVLNPWLNFKGGKGVATAFGAMMGISPLSALLAFFAWGAVVWRTRVVSLASLVAAGALPVAVLVVKWGKTGHVEFTLSALVLAGLVVFAHRENIKRLRAGEEKPVSRGE